MLPLACFPDYAVWVENRGMSEPLDPRPVFTIVMGCDGAGKSAWKRKNYDLLPSRYFDQDSFAGGIGDWNSPEARARTRVYIDAQIEESILGRLEGHLAGAPRACSDGTRPGVRGPRTGCWAEPTQCWYDASQGVAGQAGGALAWAGAGSLAAATRAPR